jgi:hypothetical protein
MGGGVGWRDGVLGGEAPDVLLALGCQGYGGWAGVGGVGEVRTHSALARVASLHTQAACWGRDTQRQPGRLLAPALARAATPPARPCGADARLKPTPPLPPLHHPFTTTTNATNVGSYHLQAAPGDRGQLPPAGRRRARRRAHLRAWAAPGACVRVGLLGRLRGGGLGAGLGCGRAEPLLGLM